jgi:hypothetical protein
MRRFAALWLALVGAAALIACQEGATRERPPRPELDGTVTGRGDDACRVGARFGLAVRGRRPGSSNFDVDIGTAWASGGTTTSTEMWASRDQVVGGLQHPQPARTAPYGGVMTIEWQANGQAVPAIDDAQGRTPALIVRGADADDLWRQFKRVDAQWSAAGRRFEFNAPPAPALVTVTAQATWAPDQNTGAASCQTDATFNLHWTDAQPLSQFPDEVPVPDPRPADDLVHAEDDKRRHVVGDAAFVVTPLRYFWSVQSLQRCCNEQGRYQVIQFARAVLESDVAWLNRTKPWGLDIPESEKQRARDRQTFDPAFTQRSGTGETQVNTHAGSSPAVSHWDGPGMSEVRYRQLLLTPGRHVLHQQFFSLLVCSRSGRRGRADALLDGHKVVKAVIYNITWTFDGAIDAPNRVDVRSQVIAREDLACRSLRDVLNVNGLAEGFRNPPESELNALEDHATALQRLRDLTRIGVP